MKKEDKSVLCYGKDAAAGLLFARVGYEEFSGDLYKAAPWDGSHLVYQVAENTTYLNSAG